jgi:hypothetical protein
MKKVSFSKLKNELSALDDKSARAIRLEGAGVIEPARRRLDLKLLLSPAPKLLKKADAVKMLLEERSGPLLTCSRGPQ